MKKVFIPKATIIFDGVCSLCNYSVDLVMRNDPRDYFRFTSNQSEAGRAILKEHGIDIAEGESANTIYLLEGGKLYQKSTGALRIARKMRFPWPILFIFILVPRFFRDWVYGIIARNRYKWFGKKETCRLPTPEERAKFIG